MKCDRAEAAVSERMDGERLARKVEESLDEHLAACPSCRAFVAGARSVRERVRLRLAEDVPDLVGSIMDRVAAERRPRRLPLRGPVPRRPSRRPGVAVPRSRPSRLRRELVRLAVALVAGAFLGSSLVSPGIGPIPRPAPPVLADDLPEQVARAAIRLTSFHARYRLTERNFAEGVPVRRFTLEVWFSAPERFRLDVLDHSPYPDPSWPGNDVTVVVNGPQWFTSGPAPCSRATFPACPVPEPEARRVDDRVPFSGPAPLLGDLVVPLDTLSDADATRVIGRRTIAARPAIGVAIPFSRATPLLSFLRQGGAWRPLHPDDSVELWLDERSWFPLRYRVLPADSPERRQWAKRHGLPAEPPDRPVLEATVLALQERIPYPGLFTIPRAPSSSQGARPVSLEDLPGQVGFRPVLPSDTQGLDLYRTVVPPVSKGGRPKEAVVTFTSGLAWLKVQERRTSQRPQPYGPVSPLAEEVTLPGGGVALFEPAQGDRPRRVSIRGADLSAYLESNLSRGDLIEVAASIPLHPVDPPTEGTPGTASGGDRLSLEEAAALVPFDIAPPGVLPPGYGLVSVELVEAGATPAVTLHFHDDSRDVAGGIRLHLAAGDGLPPASSATQFTLELAGVEGRHTPSRHQLEWVSGGVYHALDGPGLELADLLGIAESIPGPPAGEEESPGAETDTPVPDEPGTDGPALGNGATFGEWLEVGAR